MISDMPLSFQNYEIAIVGLGESGTKNINYMIDNGVWNDDMWS